MPCNFRALLSARIRSLHPTEIVCGVDALMGFLVSGVRDSTPTAEPVTRPDLKRGEMIPFARRLR